MNWTDIISTEVTESNGAKVELVRYRAWPDQWTVYVTVAGERRDVGVVYRRDDGTLTSPKSQFERLRGSKDLRIAFPNFEDFARFLRSALRS